MSVLDDIRSYDPFAIDESAIPFAHAGGAFDAAKHPRGRGGKWAPVGLGQWAGKHREATTALNSLKGRMVELHTESGILGAYRKQGKLVSVDRSNVQLEDEDGQRSTHLRSKMIHVGAPGSNPHGVDLPTRKEAANSVGAGRGHKSFEQVQKLQMIYGRKRAVSDRHPVSESRGYDPLFVGEAAVLHFDPALHPRGRRGEFANVLGRLPHGGEATLPNGVTVRRSAVSGFKITGRGGQTVHERSPDAAAQKALALHDNATPNPSYRDLPMYTEAQAHALGLFSPGGSRGARAAAATTRAQQVARDRHRDLHNDRIAKAETLVRSGLADTADEALAHLDGKPLAVRAGR